MEQLPFTDIQRSETMAYRFVIQASNPRSVRATSQEDASLSDAIQSVFLLDTENAFLVWNWIYVPLSYKYDLSLMVTDAVELVDAMTAEDIGHQVIEWPSNTFAATWKIDWADGQATIVATWDCVVGNTEVLLNAKSTVVIGVREFLREWRRPFEIIASALEDAGYTGDALPGVARLRRAIAKIDRPGILYAE
jgi:hypothetical protein